MKVDGITLLQMIKDGKIKSDTEIEVLYNDGMSEFITRLYYDGVDLKWHPGTFHARYFYNRFIEFEIIEEDKEIEEMNQDAITLGHCRDKINELIREVNKLKKESK